MIISAIWCRKKENPLRIYIALQNSPIYIRISTEGFLFVLPKFKIYNFFHDLPHTLYAAGI